MCLSKSKYDCILINNNIPNNIGTTNVLFVTSHVTS